MQKVKTRRGNGALALSYLPSPSPNKHSLFSLKRVWTLRDICGGECYLIKPNTNHKYNNLFHYFIVCVTNISIYKKLTK